MNINDELTKKLAQLAADIMAEDNTNNKSDDGEGLDKVQPKAVKKKFADRKDKDIDNDGDVDSSDEYFHKKRKAISANIKNEEAELEEARGFPESSQGAKQTYDAVVKLSASLRKGSQLNKAVNKELGGKYDSDFVKMQKAIAVIFDTLEEFDREYQGFDG
jgi:hypothetical protein